MVFLHKIRGAVQDKEPEMMHFLDTSEMKEYNNLLVNDMAEALEKARTMEDWRKDYMSIEMLKRDAREEGRMEGKFATLFNLVKEGLLSVTAAARESELSEEAFIMKMKEAGYTTA